MINGVSTLRDTRQGSLACCHPYSSLTTPERSSRLLMVRRVLMSASGNTTGGVICSVQPEGVQSELRGPGSALPLRFKAFCVFKK